MAVAPQSLRGNNQELVWNVLGYALPSSVFTIVRGTSQKLDKVNSQISPSLPVYSFISKEVRSKPRDSDYFVGWQAVVLTSSGIYIFI